MAERQFLIVALGLSADATFREQVNDAAWRRGHEGYAGTIAEKSTFVMIPDTWATVHARAQAEVTRTDLLDEDKAAAREAVALLENANVRNSRAIAKALLLLGDPRLTKGGPAGCIALQPGITDAKALRRFLFFGVAAS
jgi:hypothetical protein